MVGGKLRSLARMVDQVWYQATTFKTVKELMEGHVRLVLNYLSELDIEVNMYNEICGICIWVACFLLIARVASLVFMKLRFLCRL